jgi:hypothetical protein
MQLSQYNSEVRSTQIEGQKLSLLPARRQASNVGYVAFDVGTRISRSGTKKTALFEVV